MDDLMELAQLVRFANPLARNPKPLSESDKPACPVRCPCGQSEDGNFVQCSKCSCYSHIGCVAPADVDNWVCPYCCSESAQTLASMGVDLSKFHAQLLQSGTLHQIAKTAKQLGNTAGQLNRATNWLDIVKGRNDIYDIVQGLNEVCLPAEAASIANDEVTQEREVLNEITDILTEIAKEHAALETPFLDAVIDQISTHHEE